MNITDLISQLKTRFLDMSMGQRFGVFAVIGFAVATIVVAMMWGMAPKYQYLFTDLADTDASLIVQYLKENRVPYKLVKGGSAIMIPEESVYETRIDLAAKGLPKGGVDKGFALFDETGFSTSEFVQKINYQRALQNELANTIMSLEEVDYARVHIAMPKESIFIEDEKPAKASIVVKPRAGQSIRQTQVQGIVYLVAKSVRGLDPENISIVDIRGRVLYEGKNESDAISLASNYLDVKRSIENMLQSRAQDLLEKIVGPASAIVKVSADINMDMVKSVEDMYDPEIQVVRSEELKNEFSGSENSIGGIAGTQSNIPTGRGTSNNIPQNANSGGSNIVRNYEIARNQTETIQSPGEITRLTVSVVVDGIYKTDDEGKRIFVARQDEEIKGIENAVRHAVGFSSDRDDTISVSCIPFAQEDTDIDALSAKARLIEYGMTALKYFFIFVVILLVLLMVVRPMMRWLIRPVKVIDEMPDRKNALTSDERDEIASTELPQLEVDAKSDEMKRLIDGRRRMIQKNSKNDMETATAVIKSWLQENM